VTLRRITEERIFDDVTTDPERARLYVTAGEMGLESRPEVELMRALADAEPPQRLHVVGPSGAGKTSMIMRVVADLSRRNLKPSPEVLVLRVGDRPDVLASEHSVMKLVLDTIAVEGHRFSNIDEAVLLDASADERTRTGRQVEHRAGLTVPVVSYSASLHKAFEAAKFGANSARVRKDLEDVLRIVADAGYRPIVVLDDTEKFVAPGSGGEVDEASVTNLYHNGVRALGELPLDLIVAMHPRFETVARVGEVVHRLGMSRLEVLELPADSENPALNKILKRRMQRRGIDDELATVIELETIADLQLLYHERDRDFRSVLQLAQKAAEHAVSRGATAIAPRDVRAVVAERIL
jgi:molybdopterin-guanine dinucleotide biosynthesis protein